MVVNVKRKELYHQAKKVMKAVPSSYAPVEIKGILFEADERVGVVRMTSTNFEVTIRSTLPTSVEKSGRCVVDAALFLSILSLLPGNDIYMEIMKNGRLYIQSEKTKYEIAVLPGNNYPKVDIPYPNDTVSIKGLKSLITKSVFATAKHDPQRPVYSCVNLVISQTGTWAVATDCCGCVVQVKGDPECRGNISLLIPAPSLSLLASMADDNDVYELGVTGNNGTSQNVVLSDGAILYSAKLVSGDFYDTNKMFDALPSHIKAYASVEDLYQALDSVMAVSSSKDRIGISFDNDVLLLQCENDNGDFAGKVTAKGAVASSEKFYYYPQKLMRCLKVIKGTALLSFSKEGNLIIQNDTVRDLIAAVRPAQVEKAEDKKTRKTKAA